MIRPSTLSDRKNGVRKPLNPDYSSKGKKPQCRCRGPGPQKCFQLAVLVLYLGTWVANGVVLQGVISGRLFGKNESYNKPAAVTWFSYNFMVLSGIVVARMLVDSKNTSESKQVVSIYHYASTTWAGKLGIRRATLRCAVIAYMLMLLNVLMVLGLECISVSLSNAVYQLQTPMTLALSVCCIQQSEKWVLAQSIGALVSIAGILFIVLPPLANGSGELQDPSVSASCFASSAPILSGVLVTVASALIGGAYLVFWRIFSEQKDSTPLSKRMELMDTHMTLSMIGLCNCVVGWPILVILHFYGFEEFQPPPNAATWKLLVINGLVEYSFDASCAMAIYITSPVVVAVVAPLTIPLSMFVDNQLYGSATATMTQQHPWCTSIGVVAILAGTSLLEYKPKISCDKSSNSGSLNSGTNDPEALDAIQ